MRSLITAALLFLAVLVCVAVNGFFIHCSAEALTREAAALPESAAEADPASFAALRVSWERCRYRICLTVPAARTDGIELAFGAMESAAALGDDVQYRQARAALLWWLHRLHGAEVCTAEGIL